MTDITTEAVERLIARLEGQDPIPSRTEVAVLLTALLADRDRLLRQLEKGMKVLSMVDGEQTTRTYEDGVRDAAACCRTVADEAKSYGIPQMTMGAHTCRDAILDLIKEKSHE